MKRVFDYLNALDEQNTEKEPYSLVIFADGSGSILEGDSGKLETFDSPHELMDIITDFHIEHRDFKFDLKDDEEGLDKG